MQSDDENVNVMRNEPHYPGTYLVDMYVRTRSMQDEASSNMGVGSLIISVSPP